MAYVNETPTSDKLSASGLISFSATQSVDGNTATHAWHLVDG